MAPLSRWLPHDLPHDGVLTDEYPETTNSPATPGQGSNGALIHEKGGPMSNLSLWLVEIDDDDWDYDRFSDAAVWAKSAEEAEQIVRSAVRAKAGEPEWRKKDELWIEKPDWRLNVSPAPTEGVVLVHWHAG